MPISVSKMTGRMRGIRNDRYQMTNRNKKGMCGLPNVPRQLIHFLLAIRVPQSAFPSPWLLVVVLGAISVILSRSPLMSSYEIAQSIVCHAAEIHLAPFTARARVPISCTVRNSCSAGLVGTVLAVALAHYEKMAIPAFLAYLAVFSQFFGGLALIIGFVTRIAALGIAADMAVAIFLVHLPNGLFMNWNGNQKGEGYEYNLLAIAIAVTLVIGGGGILSFDRRIASGNGRQL